MHDNSTSGDNNTLIPKPYPNSRPNTDIIPGPSDDPVDNSKANQSRNDGEVSIKVSMKNTGIPIPALFALLSAIAVVFVRKRQI